MPNHLSAYPNPFTESLSFEVEVENNVSTIVRIVDVNGKIIRLLSWNLKKGINKTSLHELQNLTPGEYFMDIKDMKGDNMFSARLIKQ